MQEERRPNLAAVRGGAAPFGSLKMNNMRGNQTQVGITQRSKVDHGELEGDLE